MAGRGNKVGLDYFELDCHMDEKIELIEAEYGLKGFAIVVKLYQSIYSGLGYYCEWTPDISLLWAARLSGFHGGEAVRQGNVGSVSENGALPGFPKNLINDVISASIRRGIFSDELFNKYHILTSSGIQKRYLNATSKREKVSLKKEYLLITIPENRPNVVINSISGGINSISGVRNEQSRVKESREEKDNTMCKADALALFEQLWKMYPVKKGKGQVSRTQKTKLFKIGFEEMSRAIERYLEGLKREEWRKPQNGSTFFNSGYVDYLDENYEKYLPEKPKRSKAAKGQDFPQREYNFEDLEGQLLQAGGSGN